ncbi:MAG: cystathionine gamma-synthase [Streptomycetaceae bacterium]|jgi:hypothetical protein|nr:cystathionine gamma-synthase [Streptomycetaceae bacterium]
MAPPQSAPDTSVTPPADPLTGAVVPPIYQVSTYKQDAIGGLRGGEGRAGISIRG